MAYSRKYRSLMGDKNAPAGEGTRPSASFGPQSKGGASRSRGAGAAAKPSGGSGQIASGSSRERKPAATPTTSVDSSRASKPPRPPEHTSGAPELPSDLPGQVPGHDYLRWQKERRRPGWLARLFSRRRAAGPAPYLVPDAASPVLVVSGEPSGDLLGADVVHELRRAGFRNFFGTGGARMEAEDVELIERVSSMTVFGLVEALRAYRRLKALADYLVALCLERGTKLAVLIDYPGFNLRLAAMLRPYGVRVVFVVSPQLWAWKYGRIKTIRENVDLMLPLFPFEEAMYVEEGVRAECIGHPVISRIPRRLKVETPVPPAPAGVRTVGLFPGSRRGEVSRLFGPMIDAARELYAADPKLRFLVAGVEERLEPLIRAELDRAPELPVEYIFDRSLRVMEASDALVMASGTATLEGAVMGRPMALLYRISWINLILISTFIRTRYIGIVNLLARRQAMVELLQTEATPANVAAEIRRILDDEEYRAGLLEELDYVRKQLGKGNPATRAARAVAQMVQEWKAERPR